MKKLLIIILTAMIALQACKKNTPATPYTAVNAGMQQDYGFKPGTYWIFKDSVSGVTDSAYVSSAISRTITEGCILYANQPQFEEMDIAIKVDNGNAADTEQWNITIIDTVFNIWFTSNTDNVEYGEGYKLFSYPIKTGSVVPVQSCVLSADSGLVTGVYNNYALLENSYANTASILQTQMAMVPLTYNDWFFMSPQAGFVKVVFNHPTASLYRVLQLVRYHVVK